MNTELRGTSLRDEEVRTGKVFTTEWRGKIDFAYDAGVAIGQFLRGLKEGKLFGRKCRSCGRVMIPPRMFCEKCFCRSDEWVELKDTGKVNTFSISYVNTDASRRKTPQVPAVVEIDGASPGMGIMHLLDEVGDSVETIMKRVKIGTPVQAVWKPADQREGAITDILYFRPIR